MKDPLQPEETPYEILGLDRDADSVAIDTAFKAALARRVPAQQLLRAKQVLQQPTQRAVLDLFQYDPDGLSRLTSGLADPNQVGLFEAEEYRGRPSLQGRSFLEPQHRAATAAAWTERSLASFPDFDAVRALAVLRFWQALAGEADGDVPAQDWEDAIACWAMLLASEPFWTASGLAPELRGSVRALVEEKLRAALDGARQARRARGDAEGAERYAELGLALAAELRAADLLGATGLSPDGGAACGPLMLRCVGRLEAVTTAVEKALRRKPDDARLGSLRDLLSPFGPVASLLEQGKPQAALDALDAMPPDLRGSAEDSRLRGRALLEIGKQQASIGDLDTALESWDRAVRSLPEGELAAEVRSEVVAACGKQAAALSRTKLDDAIQVLQRGLEIADDEGLRLRLAEFLVDRSIETLRAGQRQAAQTGGQVPRKLAARFEQGLADLERAAKLGSSRASEQLETARALVAQAKAGMLGVAPEVAGPLATANAAAERGDWDAAVTGLREALTAGGEEAAESLTPSLAVALSQRAISSSKKAMETTSSEDQQKFLALQVALFLRNPDYSTDVATAPRKGRFLRRPRLGRPNIRDLGSWALILSPLWVAGLLFAGGVVNANEAGTLAFFLFLLLQAGAWVVSWVGRLLDTATAPFNQSPTVTAGPPCDVEGCKEHSLYSVNLADMFGAEARAGIEWLSAFGSPKHLCARHAQKLEELLKTPPASARTAGFLRSAKQDLEEALALDPDLKGARDNLRQLDDVLGKLRVPAEAPAKEARPKRRPWHKASAKPVKKSTGFGTTVVRCPPTHPVKGLERSGLYHVPGGQWYGSSTPDICFRDEEAAQAAGFKAAGSGSQKAAPKPAQKRRVARKH